MSRKDTIIVAVLVNAGLLIVLFASALKPSAAPENALVMTHETPPQELVVAPLLQEVTPQVIEPVSNAFVEDLKTIAQVDPAPTLAPAVVAETLEVKVKKGDVLEKIARHNHSTVSEIMKANNLKTSNLKIGQVLQIPQKHLPLAKEAPSSLYIIKKGDSPWTIAAKHHMKVEELLKLNNLSEAESKRLKPGDTLRTQ